MPAVTVAEGLRIGIERLWPLALLPVGALALAALILRSAGGSRSASPRSRRLLFVSRLAVVALLVAAAAGPYTAQTRETTGNPTVVLLDDRSDSTAVFPDETDALVRSIEAAGVPVTSATVGSGADSRIGDGVVANLRENGTVVVRSDGRVTGGRSLATAAERAIGLNATINAVAASPDRVERAVATDGPATVSAGLPATFTVSLSTVGPAAAATVEVRVDGSTVETREVAGDGSFTVNHTFEETGPHRVTATVDGADVYSRNDVFRRTVRVVEPPELLYVSRGEYPLRSYLTELYAVTNASRIPADLDRYSTVVLQDVPAGGLGNVSALQEHVIEGGGLVSVGGPNAYENGGYDRSALGSMLPVRVGNATGGTTDIVLLIDVSGSAQGGLSVQKAVALDVLDQLGDENGVGVVAFNQRAYRIAPVQSLRGNRTAVADRIRRLESGGATDIADGLRGADELLGGREGTVILLSDGQADPEPAAVVADQLGREGTRVIAVGAGRQVNAPNMRRIAGASGGSYFAADQTDRLRLLFGSGSRRFAGTNLTVVTPETFITSGVTLTANPGQSNRVSVKSGADYQVATAEGTPAITSWRFGLGRVVSITAYAPDGGLDGLLERPDSLVLTQSVNYAIGDPGRTRTGVTAVDPARVGERTALTYRGAERPAAEGVTFSRVDEGVYRGEFTPTEPGYRELLDTEYAANYPVEYGSFGRSPALDAAVEATGGRTFGSGEGAAIARLARQQSTSVRTVREAWDWVPLLGAFLVFLVEVIVRRVQVYRGRTTMESGLR